MTHAQDQKAIDEAARRIYRRWVDVHRAGYRVAKHPSALRMRALRRALSEFGFDEEKLQLAVEGCKASRWCQGANKAGAVFDDLSWILHRESRIERLAEEGREARATRLAYTVKVNGTTEPTEPSRMTDDVRARLAALRSHIGRGTR